MTPLAAAALVVILSASMASRTASAATPAAGPSPRSFGQVGVWAPVPGDSTQPPALSNHVAIYDPVRDRLLIFGGTDGVLHDEVWEFGLTGTPIWRMLPVTGPGPSPRAYLAGIYDPVRDRLVVAGGDDASGNRMDVWALTLGGVPAWTLLASDDGPGPAKRDDHAAIYDAYRDRLLIYGGATWPGPTYLGDVWAFDLAGSSGWTQINAAAPPPPRAQAAAIYDPVRGRLVIHGGLSGYPAKYDIWALSLAGTPTWLDLTPGSEIPPERRGHVAVYDPVADAMVIHGGDPNSAGVMSDTWAFRFATRTWSDITPASRPGGRSFMAAAYDAPRRRLVIEGGIFGPLAECWALALSSPTWTELSPVGPPQSPGRRSMHTAVFDSSRDRMLVYGGAGSDASVWSLALATAPTWSVLATSGTAPVVSQHVAVLDPVRDRMMLVAGTHSLASIPVLGLAGTPTWSTLVASGPSVSNRMRPTVLYDPPRDRLLMFGGGVPSLDYYRTLSSVWQLTLGPTPTWSQLFPTGSIPPSRMNHVAIYDPVADRMVVFGGLSAPDGFCCGETINDVWALSLGGTPQWTPITPAGSEPGPRIAASAAYDPGRHRMLVYGGASSDTVWALSLDPGETWTPLLPGGGPPGQRGGHTAIFDPDDDRMVVYGGGWNTKTYSDAWELDFTAIVSVPSPVSAAPVLIGAIPNPAMGPLQIALRLADSSPARLELFDLAGRRVAREELSLGSGLHRVTLAGTARLPAGLYLIRLEQADVVATSRAVVTR
jgi:hypothetical protein